MNVSQTAVMYSTKTGEFLQYFNNVLDVYRRADANSLNLQDQVADLQKAVEALEDVFQRAAGEEKSVDLRKFDKERMKTLRGIRFFLQAVLNRKDAEKIQLAELILRNISMNCQEISEESLPQKTAMLDALIKDITGIPVLTGAAETLQLTEDFKELARQNLDFYQLYLENALSTREPARATDKRIAARKAFSGLRKATEAFALVATDKTPYLNLLTELTKLTEKYSAPVNGRKNSKKKSDRVNESTASPGDNVSS